MSRVDIVWSMVAAVYLTLALQHLLMWLRRRESWTHLLFSVTAVATAGIAAAAARMELWVWDVENDDVWMTAQDRAALGVAPGERLDLRRLLDTIHPEDRPALEGAIRQSLQQGCEFDREYRRLLPGGTVRWFAASGQVERSPDGRPLRMCGVSLDVTQRIAAELDAQRHRNELARLGRVHLLGALSGAVAHELNQPLTAILSNAQAAQRFLAGPAPDLHEVGLILRDIVADQQRAGEIIRRLRGLLEKGESQRQPLDLNEVIQEVLRLLRSDLWHRQVVVHSSLAPELPLLYGDRVQMQQVLINLILNGCDAMQDNPPGERTLRVSTSLDGGEEPRIKICVADQGPGVATEQRESIFLPFFTTKAHGMGMGLAVCRVIKGPSRPRHGEDAGPQPGRAGAHDRAGQAGRADEPVSRRGLLA